MQYNLKKELLRLNMSEESKVHLWLVYKDQKAASTLSPNSKIDVDKILLWLNKSSINHRLNEGFKSYDDQPPIILVSKNTEILEEIDKIMTDNSPESAIRKAEIFGYPSDAAKYFVKFWQNKNKYPMISGKLMFRNGKSENYAFSAYMLRSGHEKEDAKTAFKWAEIIKKDLPELYKTYLTEVLESKVAS